MEKSATSRRHPVNSKQKEILVEFMKQHSDLKTGRFTSQFTFKKAQQLWEEIAAKLNKISNGSQKNWRQWRKTWQDLKKNAKTKASKNKMYASQTGGGPPVVEVLEKVENEILDLMTPIAIQGLPSIKESSTHFNFDTDFYDLSSFDINNDEDIPNQNPRLDTNIGDIHMEQEIQDHSVVKDIQFDEVIIDQENTVHPSTGTGNKTGNDHSYSLEFPGPKEKGIIPKKRLTKTRRLTSSLQVGQKAANSMDRRTEMFESYYEEKKNYLKHRKNYEMKKLNLLRINKNTNLQILETLKSMHKCNCSK